MVLKEDECDIGKIHGESNIVDAHNDTILKLIEEGPFVTMTRGRFDSLGNEKGFLQTPVTLSGPSNKSKVDLSKTIEGGVNCLIFSCCVSPNYNAPLIRLLQYLDKLHSAIETTKGIRLATTYQELEEALQDSQIAALISVEGGTPLKKEISVLRTINKLGVTSLILTHFGRTSLGDGSGKDFDSHLTNFGRSVIKEMNRLGMVVDLAHLNQRGFYDAIELSKDPVIVSHANVDKLVKHHRNLTDKQLRQLANKGGVIGLSFVPNFLMENGNKTNSKASTKHLLNHIDYLKDLIGIDHIGLGSDFDGGGGLSDLKDISEFPNLTKGLVERGYSPTEIEKILGENFLRVFKSVLPYQ
ncbi:dipeptidase [Candidatus Bipolaricaulota bacterium]|nr:dipeptidase [Candidatus Bipolaricaulota bacterium]